MGITNLVQNTIGKNTSKTVRMNVVNSGGTGISYFVDGKDFDCVVTISQNLSNTITKNPVEFGAPVTDNKYRNPRTYRLEGMLSSYTSIDVGTFNVAIVGNGALSSKNNAENWYAGLIEVFNLNNGGLITLTVYPQSYPNLVVETLTFDDSYIVGEGLKYTMTLREVIVASTSLSTGQTNAPSDPINNSSVNNGTATTTSAAASEIANGTIN